jgi:hypothetical protein
MRKIILLVCSGIAATSFAQKETDITKFGKLITAKELKAKLSVIAGPEMEGRGTATAGQRKAAAYIEGEFRRMGLKPGNGNSYQQYYPVFEHKMTTRNLSVNGKQFEFYKQFTYPVPAAWYYTGNNFSQVHINTTEIVFAGYGMLDSAYQLDDYAGLDVKGKLVMVLPGYPTGYPDSLGKRDGTFRGDYPYKLKQLHQKGALGMIIVQNRFPVTVPYFDEWTIISVSTNNPGFLMADVSPEVGAALLGRTGTIRYEDFKDIPKGKFTAEIKMDMVVTTTELQPSNVVGILEGSDKKDEYLLMTAHYDHLGKVGNDIYYGADDDGSGTTAVLQMAEAFTAAAKAGSKPRRTIVFMTVSGEEMGLFGSAYYAEHPIFPLDKTSADLNTDMVGRTDTERKTADSLNYVYVIGHNKLSSDLPVINEGVNSKYTQLVLDYKFDDPRDPEGIFYRSDHYNFARKGVPILFFYDGMLLADYHQPTDTVEKINFELMEKRVQLIFYTGWEIANREGMLKRDIPLQ